MQDIEILLNVNHMRKQSADAHLSRLNLAIQELEVEVSKLSLEESMAQKNVYTAENLKLSGLVYTNFEVFLQELEIRSCGLKSKIHALEERKKEYVILLRNILASNAYLNGQLQRKVKVQEKKKELYDSENLRQLSAYRDVNDIRSRITGQELL